MSDAADDSALEQELRRVAARLDPVPPEVVQAAIGAFSWRDIDAELAELVFDSLLDADQATLVRGSPAQRLVSFKTPELTVDVEVATTASGRDVMGQISPPQRATVEIRHGAGVVTTDADELGRFRAASLQAGPMSMRLRPAGASQRPAGASQRPAVVTDWLSI
jgi:hypothetical protein